MSQEEVDQRWKAGVEDFQVSGFFETDVHELARALQNWCRSPGEEFPFRFEARGVPSPVSRSALVIRLRPIIDRDWHRKRPVVFEFRPVSREEAYTLEADYWRSVSDNRRAELADEIRARSAERGNQ
jgi:hypothetical protein